MQPTQPPTMMPPTDDSEQVIGGCSSHNNTSLWIGFAIGLSLMFRRYWP